MTDEPFSESRGDGDREFDTTSGGLNDETAVSVRGPRPASPIADPAAGAGSAAADQGDRSAAAEETGSTVRVDRAPRPAVPRYAAPPELPDDTVARPRASRIPDEATIRVRRTAAHHDEAGPPPEPAREEDAPVDPAPSRVAYSPDPEALAAGYAARPAAPIIASRGGHPFRMAQPAIDGEAVDRSLRGKGRRRAVSLGAAIAFAIVVAACLLGALVASFGH